MKTPVGISRGTGYARLTESQRESIIEAFKKLRNAHPGYTDYKHLCAQVAYDLYFHGDASAWNHAHGRRSDAYAAVITVLVHNNILTLILGPGAR